MKDKPTNIGASVMARLLNRTHETGQDYQVILGSYCTERFLYRLGASASRDRFVLKGATLLRLLSDQPYRATRDLDLLRRGDGSFDTIREDIENICVVEVEPDGVSFDARAMRLDAMRSDEEYVGTRVALPARCGTARLLLQVDLGLGDDVWPTPRLRTYPALLDMAKPLILTYPMEAVIAEKLEAMIVLGDRNSRIKDYFDLHYLASHFELDRATLAESIQRTFARRRTPIPAGEPMGLTLDYWRNPLRPTQVRAFARRALLSVSDDPGGELLPVLRAFLLPLVKDVRRGTPQPGTWPPGGPWS
jgi:predicted nucleotidyltransferase component of viral defense system